MRVSKGIARHELAHAVGISYASLSRLEAGMVINAPLWWYGNCAIALGVELDEILDEQDRMWRRRPAAPRPPGPDWPKRK